MMKIVNQLVNKECLFLILTYRVKKGGEVQGKYCISTFAYEI